MKINDPSSDFQWLIKENLVLIARIETSEIANKK
jgi:hypothetical protein